MSNIYSAHRHAALLLLSLSLTPSLWAQAPERKVVSERALMGAKPQSVAQEKNLFSGAKITASPHWQTDVPAKAIDGKIDADSFWGAENIPVSYQLDMGSAKPLSRIQIWPYWKDGRIYQYKIEGSKDGKSWKMLADQRANSIAGTASGSQYRFETQPLRYVRVTFTNNSNGKAQGGHLVEIQGFSSSEGGAMKVAAYKDDVRLPWTGSNYPAPLKGNKIELTGWRGERVNAQLLVTSPTALEQLHVRSAKLKNEKGETLPLSARFVTFTRGQHAPMADVIAELPEQRLDNPAGVNRSIWLSLDIPRDASPGLYKGSVLVGAAKEKPQRIPVQIEVLALRIPAPLDWEAHVDLWQYPDSVARYHGVEPWSDVHFALMKPLMKRLADAGQKVILASIMHEAWGGQTYDHFPSMIQWVRKADGSMRWDYTIFDKWVHFMIHEIGIKDQISCYTMVPWSNKLRVYDEKSGSYVDLPCNPGSAEYEKLWGPFLADFTKHLEKKGWMDIACIGMDERPDHMVRAANAVMKKYGPKFKVVSAVNSPSKASAIVHDMSPIIGHTNMVTPQMLAERKRAGKKTTYYVCVNPARPNTFTQSPLVESEWLGIFAAVHEFDGFLRWAYNAWNRDPMESTVFGNWPAGDCFLVYPNNQSSLRFEKLRDGLEEFEKIHIMRKRAQKDPAFKAKFDAFIKELLPLFDKSKTLHLDYKKGVDAYHQGMKKLQAELAR